MTKCLAALVLGFLFTLVMAILKGIGNLLFSPEKNTPPSQSAEKTQEEATDDKTENTTQGDQPPSS